LHLSLIALANNCCLPSFLHDALPISATLAPKLNQLIEDAKPKATPADTRAILDAASFRGIPWLKLEKTGLSYHDGDFRLRKNSLDRKSTRLNSSHVKISYAVFCLKKK